MKLVNLSKRTKKLDCTLEASAIFDALLIALMFTLLSSNFIVAEGIELGTVSSETHGSPADASIDVLSATSGNMLIYRGEIFSVNSFEKKMATKKHEGYTLLIKADKNVNAEAILKICEAAKVGGFKQVMLAAKPYKY